MASQIAAGPQRIVVPISGTSANSIASTPKTSGDGTPAKKNPTPSSAPCTIAVSPIPTKTARVISIR